ncbi:alpha/beta fold hydrolase [Salinibacterium hongtaonis]|uniref:alpha/beta fold hydrolase n=1 Tax=Homoserinimonas hongtaonis TaxID=2079791 RepID=UPI000D3D0702|nr:hypothetical protein C2138_07325 [Salinibacterium hongtaonis]
MHLPRIRLTVTAEQVGDPDRAQSDVEVDVFSMAPHPAATEFVLLHGIGMSHRSLARLQEQLAANGTVHSIDLPGFGATPRPEQPLSVEDHARVLGATFDALDVRHCVVVGHSMGAQFAIELARQRPDLVDRLVLIGPVVDPQRSTVLQQAAALAADTLLEPPVANALVLSDYLRCGPRWYLQTLPSMMRYPTLERVREVSCPVLVIRGEKDPVAREGFSRQLANAAPNGSLLQMPGHAHIVQHSAPRSVAAAIARFAEGVPAAGSRLPERSAKPGALTRWLWWVRDYAYAGWWQVRSVLPGSPPESFADGPRRPIVVVPGVYETWRFLQPLISRLHEAGHPVHVIPTLHHNRRPVEDTARLVSSYLLENDLSDVVIVAHSKGGLIGKAVMLDPAVSERVSGMVAVSTPFSGSRYALWMLAPSLRAFSPYAPTTLRLAREHKVNSRIRSIFGIFDPHIPEGSYLPGADNVRLSIGGHFRILADERTVQLVLDAAARGVGTPASPRKESPAKGSIIPIG